MKRTLSLLLAVIMLIALFPASGLADTVMRVTGGWLRLRSAPSYDAETLASYFTGTEVTVIGTSGVWYHVVTADAKTGYMLANYLTPASSGSSSQGGGGGGSAAPTPTPTPVTPSGSTAFVISENGAGVKLRTGPGTNFGVLGVYPVGTEATILSYGETWSYIRVGSVNGYMMSKFLTAGSTPTPSYDYTAYVTSTNGLGVRMRTGAGLNYDVVGIYPVGTEVTVLEHNDVWDYIQIGSLYGYMMNRYLTTTLTKHEITEVSVSNLQPSVNDVLSAIVLPSGATYTCRWTDQNGKTLSTAKTYTVQSGDLGKRISVIVTGTGLYSGTASSAATAYVTGTSYKVTNAWISNTTPAVGNTLTASVAPTGASAQLWWYRSDGTLLGSGTSYTVQSADAGYTLRVRAIGTGSYSGDVYSAYTSTVTSKSSSHKVTAATINNTSPFVGNTLTVTVYPVGANATVLWYRSDGSLVGSGTAYTVQSADAGYSLRVRAIGTGSYSGDVYSAYTSAVVNKSASKQAVSGKIVLPDFVVAGAKITATVSSMNTSAVTYQWYLDGYPTGVTGLSYTVPKNTSGLITLRATALANSGYTGWIESNDATIIGSSGGGGGSSIVDYDSSASPVTMTDMK